MSVLPPQEVKTEAKTIAQSRVELIQLMGPQNANSLGNVHGGHIMKLCDEAGALAAMRHAQSIVVTVAMDSMTFDEPILVGHLVKISAELTYAGRTSMEARVEVIAEHPLTGEKTHTNRAYLVYVAIDSQHKPRPVPPLVATTPEEEAIMQAARERQEYRKLRNVREEQIIHMQAQNKPT